MDNGINERQNEEKSIRYLAAQRQLYSEAKCWNNILIFFSVVVPVILVITREVFEICEIFKIFTYVYPILSLIAVYFINSIVCKKKRIAAEIQQHFDTYVFQMPWDDNQFGKKSDLSSIIAQKSEKLLKCDKEREKLINWYTNIDSGLNLLKAISLCQKINFYWDINLRERVKNGIIIAIIVLILLLYIIAIINDQTIRHFTISLWIMLPILKWSWNDVILKIVGDIKLLNEINNLFNEKNKYTMRKLEIIQSKIYTHRKNSFIIPDLVYNIFKKDDKNIISIIFSTLIKNSLLKYN